MSERQCPWEPTVWTEGPDERSRQHDELLRMRCLELAGANPLQARGFYHEVTGRDWPTWRGAKLPSEVCAVCKLPATQCDGHWRQPTADEDGAWGNSK